MPPKRTVIATILIIIHKNTCYFASLCRFFSFFRWTAVPAEVGGAESAGPRAATSLLKKKTGPPWPVAWRTDLGKSAAPCPLRPARNLGRDRRQIFRSAGFIAMGQANPHTGAADDDVVHTDETAFEKELGSGLVQNHCGRVESGSGATMTFGYALWCRDIQAKAGRNAKNLKCARVLLTSPPNP
jgi:hypothetical protein